MIRILQTSEKDWKSDRTFAWSLAEQSDAIAEELKQTKLRITSAKLSILEKKNRQRTRSAHRQS